MCDSFSHLYMLSDAWKTQETKELLPVQLLWGVYGQSPPSMDSSDWSACFLTLCKV